MRCFWDERQRDHAPVAEFFSGNLHPAAEHQGRVDAILAAIGRTEVPKDQGMDPILAVHDPGYLGFLREAHAHWLAAGRQGDAFPYTFPIVGRRPLELSRIDARLGQFGFDTSSSIGPGTWQACYWSVQTALAGLEAVLDGERSAFAFTRPPGHHAGGNYFGGYSYLNHAAVSAAAALCAGLRRIAVLDVDYHHGNGTQDIFTGREDVVFASIHADPSTDYPFFWGHAEESGGNILNLPLPRGTDWSGYAPALTKALDWIDRSAPDLLVVSYGADTHEADPISHFKLKTKDYAPMARCIASMGLPTLIVMEGGYAVEALGANIAEFLSGF